MKDETVIAIAFVLIAAAVIRFCIDVVLRRYDQVYKSLNKKIKIHDDNRPESE